MRFLLLCVCFDLRISCLDLAAYAFPKLRVRNQAVLEAQAHSSDPQSSSPSSVGDQALIGTSPSSVHLPVPASPCHQSLRVGARLHVVLWVWFPSQSLGRTRFGCQDSPDELLLVNWAVPQVIWYFVSFFHREAFLRACRMEGEGTRLLWHWGTLKEKNYFSCTRRVFELRMIIKTISITTTTTSKQAGYSQIQGQSICLACTWLNPQH